MDGPVLDEKSFFKILGLTFSSKLDLGFYIIPITKTDSKKIEALIRSMKFLSPEVALYLYKSIIWRCMEYCCHAWADALSCYLELLDKLQKAFSVGITLVDVHLNWLIWFHFVILEGGLLVILIDCTIFLSPFLDVTRMPIATVSFLTQQDYRILCL